jgi:hypothetical protein
MAQLVIEESAEGPECVDEGLLIRVADLPDHVPVAPAGWHVGQRCPRGHAEELAIGIQLIEHRVEVALIDGAAVEQDQGALRLARRLAGQMHHLHDLARPLAGWWLRLGHEGW